MVERTGLAIVKKESASFTLTPTVRIGKVVVSNIPTRAFKEGKSELGYFHLVDKTRSHHLVAEHSSFEVRTSSARATTVFHVSTLEIGASEVVSESVSEGRNVQNFARTAIIRRSSKMTVKSLTIAANEMLVQG